MATVLAGCASAPQVRDEQPSAIESADKEIQPAVVPVAMTAAGVAPELEAVSYLLDQAESAEQNRKYDLAQVLAERAMRIQRTAARAYLVLASVHAALGNKDSASDFARQGLLYSPDGSAIRQRLIELLRSL